MGIQKRALGQLGLCTCGPCSSKTCDWLMRVSRRVAVDSCTRFGQLNLLTSRIMSEFCNAAGKLKEAKNKERLGVRALV
jgi:hypothetical protein